MKAAEGFSLIAQPDLKQVSELICSSWARPCWNYDEGLLQLHIMRPSGDPELAIGQVSDDDGRLASFQAYMPFDIEYFGESYKAVFASFLTVSGDFRGRGLASPQQAALIEKAIEKDYDLYLTMCEVDAVSNIAVEKVFARNNLEVKIVNVLNYLASPAKLIKAVLPETSSPNTRSCRNDDLQAVTKLMSNIGKEMPLRKIVPEHDVKFLLYTREHAKTFVYEKNGSVIGLVNILLLEVLEEEGSHLNLYFDNIAIDQLNDDEQIEFIGDVMLTLQSEKYNMAFVPNIGYTQINAFKKFRFREAPRQINLYIGQLKKNVLPDGIKLVDSFYLDVY